MKKNCIIILVFLFFSFHASTQESVNNIKQILGTEEWGISYYTDILKSKQRETIYTYVSYYKENPEYYLEYLDDWVFWYEKDHWSKDYITILSSQQDNYLYISPLHYYEIIDTTKNKASTLFKISVFVSNNKMEDNKRVDKYVNANWNLINDKSEFTFLFLFDGDYLDIFIDDFDTYFTTFCHFYGSAWEQLESLIYTNTCDLTNVTFPRRADKNHTVGISCIVAENLRLRKEESTSSVTLQTMQTGTSVKILQLGKKQTIDGITANWVQVELDDGIKGWCFGGYLVEK